MAWVVIAIAVKTIGWRAVVMAMGAYYAKISHDNTQEHGPYKSGAKSQWFRNWTVWKAFAGYFPAKVVKTAELPPSQGPIRVRVRVRSFLLVKVQLGLGLGLGASS